VEPGVFGIFRPVLLLPEGIAERLSAAQLEAILAHELCHVRRRDNLTAAIHMIVQATFWFHPLVWWLGMRLTDERERACDEEVLRLGSTPRVYAEGILNVCKLYVESPLACVSGVTGSNLKRRVEAIMKNRMVPRLNFAKKAVLAAVGVAALAAPVAIGVVRAQSPVVTALEFEVASVKPSPAGLVRDTGGVQIQFPPGGGFRASNVTLKDLVMTAYNMDSWQVSGGPEWGDPSGMTTDDRFVVNAKAPSAASRSQVRRMLQTLLADRFKLQFHRENKTQTVYDLVVAKNGPKLQRVRVDDYPGNLVTRCCRGGMYMERTTMADFAAVFTMMGVPTTVRDKTGLKGIYKFELHWSPEAFRSGEKQDVPGNGEPAFDPDGPSIFTALREQLGLALEGAKGQVEILVIDHAEKPSEN
jgi:bla regulator protein blaR1